MKINPTVTYFTKLISNARLQGITGIDFIIMAQNKNRFGNINITTVSFFTVLITPVRIVFFTHKISHLLSVCRVLTTAALCVDTGKVDTVIVVKLFLHTYKKRVTPVVGAVKISFFGPAV